MLFLLVLRFRHLSDQVIDAKFWVLILNLGG